MKKSIHLFGLFNRNAVTPLRNNNLILYLFLIIFFVIPLSGCLKKIAKKVAMKGVVENLDPEIVEKLKKTKTVFFYTKEDKDRLDTLRKAVEGAWKLTPIIFAEISESNKYLSDEKYSYFSIDLVISEYGPVTNYLTYLTLHLPNGVDKKGNPKSEDLCRIELILNKNKSEVGNYDLRKSSEAFKFLYNNAHFDNWSPALIYANLQEVNSNLEVNFCPWFYAEKKDVAMIQELKTDTIYIPENIIYGYRAFSKKLQSSEDAFSNYPGKYKICTPSELSNKILYSNSGRFLFSYTRDARSESFITIFDTKNKKIIYRKYFPSNAGTVIAKRNIDEIFK